MFESGALVCLGLVMWFTKCSWTTRIKILSYPLAVDLLVFGFLTIIHWGTFSGVMAATVGALMTSMLMTAGRTLWGYNQDDKYVAGYFNISHKLEIK